MKRKPNRLICCFAISLIFHLGERAAFSDMTITGSDAAADSASIIWWDNSALSPRYYFIRSENAGWISPSQVVGIDSGTLNIVAPSGISITPLYQFWDANHDSSLVGSAVGSWTHTLSLNGNSQGNNGGPGPVLSLLSVGTNGFSIGSFGVGSNWAIGGEMDVSAYAGSSGATMAAVATLAGFMSYGYTIPDPASPTGGGGFGGASSSGWALFGASYAGTYSAGTGSIGLSGLAIDSSGTYMLTGPGTILFNAPSSGAAQALVSITGSGSITQTISAPIQINTKTVFSVDADQTLAVSGTLNISNSAPIVKASAGTVLLPHFTSTGPLSIAEGTLKLNSDAGVTKIAALLLTPRPANVGSLSISPSVLDLSSAGSGLIVDYNLGTASDPSAFSQINLKSLSPLGTSQAGSSGLVKLIKDGFNAGNWQGPSQSGGEVLPFITSEAAQNDSRLRIGYAEASDLLGSSGGTFMGTSVDSSSALMKVTWGGDANMDGQVDILDLDALAIHWNSASDWIGGDFNYDGVVNVADLLVLAENWQVGVGDPLAPPLAPILSSLGLPEVFVPEPATFCSMFCALWFLGHRRRKWQTPKI